MLTVRNGSMACLVVVLTLATLAPGLAQDAEPVDIETAYEAMLAAAAEQSWEAAYSQARVVMLAADQAGWDALTADQLYMLGIAGYYTMGMAFEAALPKEPGLSPERKQFAQKMADMVLRGGQTAGVKVISHGEQINLEEHLTEGMITIVDFYSEFCPPCVAVAPVLENLVTERSDLALVKVDVNRPGHQGIDWQSPVSQQFKLRSIPYFRIYAADGKLMAEGERAGSLLMRWVQEL